MKNYNVHIILVFIIGMYSCNSKVKSNLDEKDVTIENVVSSSTSQYEPTKGVRFMDTIYINYSDHKMLLTVLKTLPESTMDSWEWTKKDRTKTIEFIEKNNYLIDSTEMYNNIKYIKSNTIGIEVVDGFWTLSIYNFTDNNHFIVTNDIVGDGNDIQTFNFFNNQLIPTKMINWFSDFDYKLLINNTPNCIEALEENQLTYSYDFTDKTNVTISSWLLTKNESKNCFKGNSITYKLNKANRTFDVVNVYWDVEDETSENIKGIEKVLSNVNSKHSSSKIAIPSGFSELTESPSNGQKIKKVMIHFDNDTIKDEALLIENDSEFSNYKLLIYVTSLQKQFEINLISTNDLGVYPVPLKTTKNVIEFGYYEDGTASFGRSIKLRYHTQKEEIQVIGYDCAYKASPSQHIDKSYNVLTGNYSVKKTNYNASEKGKIETFSGRDEVFKKKVFLENLNLNMLTNLDTIGSEFE